MPRINGNFKTTSQPDNTHSLDKRKNDEKNKANFNGWEAKMKTPAEKHGEIIRQANNHGANQRNQNSNSFSIRDVAPGVVFTALIFASYVPTADGHPSNIREQQAQNNSAVGNPLQDIQAQKPPSLAFNEDLNPTKPSFLDTSASTTSPQPPRFNREELKIKKNLDDFISPIKSQIQKVIFDNAEKNAISKISHTDFSSTKYISINEVIDIKNKALLQQHDFQKKKIKTNIEYSAGKLYITPEITSSEARSITGRSIAIKVHPFTAKMLDSKMHDKIDNLLGINIDALSKEDNFWNKYFDGMCTINGKYNTDVAEGMYERSSKKLFPIYSYNIRISPEEPYNSDTITLADLPMHFHIMTQGINGKYYSLFKEYELFRDSMRENYLFHNNDFCKNIKKSELFSKCNYKLDNNFINIMVMSIFDGIKPDFAILLSPTITLDKITEYNKNITIINDPEWQHTIGKLFIEMYADDTFYLNEDRENNIHFGNKNNMATGLPNGFAATDVLNENRLDISYDVYLEQGRKITIAGINPLYTKFGNSPGSTIVLEVKNPPTDLKDISKLETKFYLKTQEGKVRNFENQDSHDNFQQILLAAYINKCGAKNIQIRVDNQTFNIKALGFNNNLTSETGFNSLRDNYTTHYYSLMNWLFSEAENITSSIADIYKYSPAITVNLDDEVVKANIFGHDVINNSTITTDKTSSTAVKINKFLTDINKIHRKKKYGDTNGIINQTLTFENVDADLATSIHEFEARIKYNSKTGNYELGEFDSTVKNDDSNFERFFNRNLNNFKVLILKAKDGVNFFKVFNISSADNHTTDASIISNGIIYPLTTPDTLKDVLVDSYKREVKYKNIDLKELPVTQQQMLLHNAFDRLDYAQLVSGYNQKKEQNVINMKIVKRTFNEIFHTNNDTTLAREAETYLDLRNAKKAHKIINDSHLSVLTNNGIECTLSLEFNVVNGQLHTSGANLASSLHMNVDMKNYFYNNYVLENLDILNILADPEKSDLNLTTNIFIKVDDRLELIYQGDKPKTAYKHIKQIYAKNNIPIDNRLAEKHRNRNRHEEL
jgi:hypothetical protein